MAGFTNDVNNIFRDAAVLGTTTITTTAQVAINPQIESGNAVTTGLLVNPIFTQSATVYGEQIAPQFFPGNGVTYAAAYGLSISTPIAPSGSGYVSNAYGLMVAGPTLSSNIVTNAYSLYITNVSGSGTVTTNYTALLSDSNGVSLVGIGTPTPRYTLDVNGTINTLRVYQCGRTNDNQLITLATGYNQGGFGAGSVGTNKVMSLNRTEYFDMDSFGIPMNEMKGGVFDGRYIYMLPGDSFNPRGLSVRYDTTLPFLSMSSYTVFDLYSKISVFSKGFSGGVYDGRYIYMIPFSDYYFTRYDTSMVFNSTSSYTAYNLQSLSSECRRFSCGVFDGRYIYFVPSVNTVALRYDTTLSFTVSSSYVVFSWDFVGTFSYGFSGGVFDGQYVYFVPDYREVFFGKVLRYDTNSSFTVATSYTVFDTELVSGDSHGFVGGVFDGRYVYFVPSTNFVAGTVTRYDTLQSFTSLNSYTIFNTNSLSSTSYGYSGGTFDGRYIYFIPHHFGNVTRYDTTMSFRNINSYTTFDVSINHATAINFYGAVYDGRYLYLTPGVEHVMVRMEAYPGPLATAMVADKAPNGFAVGEYAGIATPAVNDLIVSGNVGIGLSTPTFSLQLATNSAAKPFTASWDVTSDIRIKRNIQNIPDALNVIRQLRPRTFNFHPDYAKDVKIDPDKNYFGFVADEVENVLEGCVHVSGVHCYGGKQNELQKGKIGQATPISGLTHLKNFDIHNVIIFGIQAVKELIAHVKSLQQRVQNRRDKK